MALYAESISRQWTFQIIRYSNTLICLHLVFVLNINKQLIMPLNCRIWKKKSKYIRWYSKINNVNYSSRSVYRYFFIDFENFERTEYIQAKWEGSEQASRNLNFNQVLIMRLNSGKKKALTKNRIGVQRALLEALVRFNPLNPNSSEQYDTCNLGVSR